MWSAQLLTVFRHLEVKAPDGVYELMPGVLLVVGDDYKADILDDEFVKFAGAIEYSHFQKSSHLVVMQWEKDFLGHKVGGLFLLEQWLAWIYWLIQDSWLVKDNSIACEVAYAKVDSSKGVEWSSNGLFTQYSDVTGDHLKSTIFDEADLKIWNEVTDSVRAAVYKKGFNNAPLTDKSYTRFGRFVSFINLARTTNNPAMKIAQCCSALESLFSTDKSELTHRLSERVAFFLGEHGEDKEQVYQLIKECYAVRSSVVHGSHVKEGKGFTNQEKCRLLFELLKKIATVLLNNSQIEKVLEGSNESIDSYFRSLLFAPR